MDSMLGWDDMNGDDEVLGADIIGLAPEEVIGRQRRARRVAKRSGLVAMTPAQMQQRINAAAVAQAQTSGTPQSLPGGQLATSGQRHEVATLGFGTMAAAVGSPLTLTGNIQRPLQGTRLFLQAADSTTGADQLFSVGLQNVSIGAHNLFVTPNVIGPASMFASGAWGSQLMTDGLRQGGIVTIIFERIALVAQPGVISGGILGFSARG